MSWSPRRRKIDTSSRFKVLEELVEKCDTPEQISLLMEMNVDRTAGLLQEIYRLEGELQGYKEINQGFINRFWDNYDSFLDNRREDD